jgi:PBP1b-binding outer membrane lipoprotein LpoB
MKRIIGILTLSCLLFSACGKDEIPQEENEKKTEETTPGDDTGGGMNRMMILILRSWLFLYM